MKYGKFTRQEKKEIRRKNVETVLQGSGLYLYENNTDADMTLPRPTKSGLRSVGPRQQFQGDNYYMQLVRSGYLRLIKELASPEQKQTKTQILNEEKMSNEDKLILDQPDKVTNEGKVEHVKANEPQQSLKESGNQPKPDVLINESPVEDGFVIID